MVTIRRVYNGWTFYGWTVTVGADADNQEETWVYQIQNGPDENTEENEAFKNMLIDLLVFMGPQQSKHNESLIRIELLRKESQNDAEG